MIPSLIIGTILILGAICFRIDNDIKLARFTATLGLLLISLTCAIDLINSHNKPTAMDVYRDKTTLMITYKDSVAVDTVVVYK